MLKFLTQIMEWWHGERTYPAHDFVEPPTVSRKEPEVFVPPKQELAVVNEIPMPLVVQEWRKPTLDEALAIVTEHYHVHAKARGVYEGQHRGRDFSFAPNASDAKHMAPPELNEIVEMLKKRWQPFILVAVDRSMYSGAAHGWCNGSNFGADAVHELMRCAELNFRQELAKCGGSQGGGRSMPISGVDRPSLYPPRK